MKNNLKKLLVLLLAANMFAGAALPTFAEEVVPENGTEIVENEDGTKKEVITTVTEETDGEGNTTITVKIEETIDETTGNVTDDGVTVNYEQTTTTTTTTDEEGTEIGSSEVVDGSETKEWTEEDSGDGEQTEVEVELIPGETTEATASETTVTGDEENGTTTTVTDRTVTVETSEITTTVTSSTTEMTSPQPELKFDRNNEADQKQQKKDRELYTDNGHFANPESIKVTDVPEDYPFQYVGTGDYSGHYVSHIRVIYERDEEGNALKDENGEYIIKELQHSNGTVLTKNGVPTTDLEGPYDQTTGTRPTQFLLMNEAGDSVYAYCIDMETGTADNKPWYAVGNLEDNDYYASEEAENHIRNIVMNGYWGTSNEQKEDGSYETGSLAKIKKELKEALADGKLPAEQDVTFVIRGAKYTEGYELQEGEYIGNGYICKHVTEHIVLNDEVIDALTEGEAFDATQMAIWSYANGSNHALDGTDRMIVGDVYYGSCALGDSLNKQNDHAGAARTRALYEYLIALDEKQESTIVINEKNNIDDMSLTIGDKAAGHEANYDDDENNDVYEAELNFTLEFVPDPENDDLLVHITYKQDGKDVTVVRRLAGENSDGRSHEIILPDEAGVYTLNGLQLSENEELTFDLRLEGIQYLEKGAYIYTAQGGIDKSQTMVGIAEGKHSVDISKALTVTFDVDEDNHVVAERHWHEEIDPEIDPEDPTPDPEPKDPKPEPKKPTPEVKEPEQKPEEPTKKKFSFKLKVENEPEEIVEIPEEEIPLVNIPDEEIPLTDIPDEPVPLTGDSMFWYITGTIAALGLCVLNLLGKKKNHNA